MCQAYLYDHNERFFEGWYLDLSWTLCTISWSILVLAALGITAGVMLFPEPFRRFIKPLLPASKDMQNIHQTVRSLLFQNADRSLENEEPNVFSHYISTSKNMDEEDIVATAEVCSYYGAPLLSRGGGTSLAGQCCNVAVVIDMSKYMYKVLDVDVERRLARVQPGLVLDHLRKRTTKDGLTFGPDPSTHNHCTLGGMIGNNSCGVHSMMSVNNGLGARTSDNVHQMEILTYDGVRMTVGPTSEEELERIIRGGGRKGEGRTEEGGVIFLDGGASRIAGGDAWGMAVPCPSAGAQARKVFEYGSKRELMQLPPDVRRGLARGGGEGAVVSSWDGTGAGTRMALAAGRGKAVP